MTVQETANPRTTGWKWDFRLPLKFAQWRPFAGRMSLKTYLHGHAVQHLKVHDVRQLLEVLERWRTSSGSSL